MMITTKVWKKQNGESLDTVKRRNDDAGFNLNPCGGCNTCHQMTSIHSMPASHIWDGGGGEGSDMQKPCATNFFQRNMGNSYMQSVAKNSVPMLQKKCACGGSCSDCAGKDEEGKDKIQTKLAISQPGDPYEQEAEQVADQIMLMPEPKQSLSDELQPDSRHNNVISQSESNRSSQVYRQSIEEEKDETTLEAKEISGFSTKAVLNVQKDVNALKGHGQPLSKSLRSMFEPRFQCDFSHVRIHTDTATSRAAREINARAFTTGHDIAFGEGEYEPETKKGQHLIAHELTHVIQQAGGQGLVHRATAREKEESMERSVKIPQWLVNQFDEKRTEEETKVARTLAGSKVNQLSDVNQAPIIFRATSGPAVGDCSWTCPPKGAHPYAPVASSSFNCYAYAMDSPGSDFLQPGQIANTLEFRAHSGDPAAIAALGGPAAAKTHLLNHYYTPSGMLNQFTADLGGVFSSNCLGCCTGTNRKIIAVTTDSMSSVGYGHWDFHWYRKDSDRGWSHKPGGTPSTREDASGGEPICSPCRASRSYPGLNYNHVVGAWCI